MGHFSTKIATNFELPDIELSSVKQSPTVRLLRRFLLKTFRSYPQEAVFMKP